VVERACTIHPLFLGAAPRRRHRSSDNLAPLILYPMPIGQSYPQQLSANPPYPEVMDSDVLDIDTSRRRIVDLTEPVRSFCASHGNGHSSGLVNAFVPHATARAAIIETGAGSDEDRCWEPGRVWCWST
jgi:hypothetical protein